ncbi:hypothetical protein B0H16DRAFT_1705705 [Mycena metata]|uniref:BTB domain-containing protein n=1 Tax=Mycena metata TaxID=1033252 RepID=A0AAD7DVV7_9AGAR|nr:hypothetical protein B0H16DRAFT_1705705 [Mycena metata]
MAAVFGKRHSRLYFADGTFTLKAEDGTYYNVNRELLILKSDFFCGMLSLPIPGHPPLRLNQTSKELLQKAKEAGLDGTSDETAVKFPPHFTSSECDIFLEFIFNILPWTKDSPGLDRLCALLKTCDFYAVESGMEYATHHLENHPDLRAALRYQLASTYHIARWAHRAFREMMSASILDLSLQEEAWLGWDAYRVLVRTHAQVAKYRLTLAFFPPDVVHAHFCYDKAYCQSRWEANWVGLTGGLGTLLMDEVSGAEMHDGLSEMEVPGMTGECRLLTITSIQDTPSEKSLLRKEEQLVETAVEALIKTWA